MRGHGASHAGFGNRVRKRSATTLVELSVGMSVTAAIVAALFYGIVHIRKAFVGAEHDVLSQSSQLRLLDWVALDLRRALAASKQTGTEGDELLVTIPDYLVWDASANGGRGGLVPRDPQLIDGLIVYGDPAHQVQVHYYKRGQEVLRSENGTATTVADQVSDFRISIPDATGQVIEVTATFMPRFQWGTGSAAVRRGTTATVRTLLRNRRRD